MAARSTAAGLTNASDPRLTIGRIGLTRGSVRTTSGRPAVIGEAREQLTIWGDWTRRGGDLTGTEYKSPAAALIRAMRGGVVGMPSIPDEVPCRIDRHMARLKQCDREMYEAVRMYYVDRKTYHGVSKALRVDRRKASTLVTAGEHWIAGRLDVDAS